MSWCAVSREVDSDGISAVTAWHDYQRTNAGFVGFADSLKITDPYTSLSRPPPATAPPLQYQTAQVTEALREWVQKLKRALIRKSRPASGA